MLFINDAIGQPWHLFTTSTNTQVTGWFSHSWFIIIRCSQNMTKISSCKQSWASASGNSFLMPSSFTHNNRLQTPTTLILLTFSNSSHPRRMASPNKMSSKSTPSQVRSCGKRHFLLPYPWALWSWPKPSSTFSMRASPTWSMTFETSWWGASTWLANPRRPWETPMKSP